jgi:hypothetical protein
MLKSMFFKTMTELNEILNESKKVITSIPNADTEDAVEEVKD